MVFGRLFASGRRLAQLATTTAGAGVAVGVASYSAMGSGAGVAPRVACVAPNGNGDDENSILDRDSGKSFLRRMSLFSGNPGVLVGAACRRRYGLISVYGVGLYVKEDEAQQLSSPTDILSGNVEAEMQFKFCRSMDRESVLETIKEAMEPRMPEGQSGTLDTFIETLHDTIDGSFTDDMVLGFHWDAGVLTMYVEGGHHEHLTEIGLRSEAIPRALFAAYLDGEAVVPPEKFSEGLQELNGAAAAAAAAAEAEVAAALEDTSKA